MVNWKNLWACIACPITCTSKNVTSSSFHRIIDLPPRTCSNMRVPLSFDRASFDGRGKIRDTIESVKSRHSEEGEVALIYFLAFPWYANNIHRCFLPHTSCRIAFSIAKWEVVLSRRGTFIRYRFATSVTSISAVLLIKAGLKVKVDFWETVLDNPS